MNSTHLIHSFAFLELLHLPNLKCFTKQYDGDHCIIELVEQCMKNSFIESIEPLSVFLKFWSITYTANNTFDMCLNRNNLLLKMNAIWRCGLCLHAVFLHFTVTFT